MKKALIDAIVVAGISLAGWLNVAAVIVIAGIVTILILLWFMARSMSTLKDGTSELLTKVGELQGAVDSIVESSATTIVEPSAEDG